MVHVCSDQLRHDTTKQQMDLSEPERCENFELYKARHCLAPRISSHRKYGSDRYDRCRSFGSFPVSSSKYVVWLSLMGASSGQSAWSTALYRY
eukprot:scaffold382269_cov21-Prasinocladus_malaysianus.AAC.1